jgi:hypothetical protein
MALRVIDHYPAINTVGVPRNAHVKVQFNKAITPNTITYTTYSINEAVTYSTVAGNLGVEYNASGEAVYAVFEPTINLNAGTKYRVYVFARPNSIVSTDNEQLDNTYTFEFTAGSGLTYDETETGIPSGETSYGDDVDSTESGVLTDGFYIISTDPQDQEPNVDIVIDKIRIKFNAEITTSVEDMSGLISMSEVDVLF